jgi:hypothetical protein
VDVPVRRQYFRLVLGEVTAWFADHSTANPLFPTPQLPASVRVVHGNKFAIQPSYQRSWNTSVPPAISAGYCMQELRQFLFRNDLGHLLAHCSTIGIVNMEKLAYRVNEYDYSIKDTFLEFDGSYYYESSRFDALCKVL